MVKSRRDGGEKFFAAVTKNCKTAVEITEKAVREEIAQQGVTKNNVAVFECRFNGININKKIIHKRTFTLMARHRTVLKNACFDFLKERAGA